MTTQQKPEALRHASYLEDFFISEVVNATRARQIATELRRLHAENERLAALVEAQQPAPLCTRSHPHEQMTWRCQVLSVVAELRNMEARGQEATEHELGRFADRLDVALQPAPSAAAVDECRRCVGTGRIDTGKGALGHEVYADCPDCQPSPTPQADSQPAPASWLTNPAPTPEREFAEWLNERRGFPVSAVFHEIMHKFAARATADSVTAPAGGVVVQPSCPGIPRPGCNYLAQCESVCNKCGKLHSTRFLEDSQPVAAARRWSTYEQAIADPIFQTARSIMGTENIGQDRQLVKAINHVIDSTPPAQAADSVLEDAARLLRQILAASQDGDSDTHLSAHFVSRIKTITKTGSTA